MGGKWFVFEADFNCKSLYLASSIMIITGDLSVILCMWGFSNGKIWKSMMIEGNALVRNRV